jgi:hypothetical protein
MEHKLLRGTSWEIFFKNRNSVFMPTGTGPWEIIEYYTHYLVRKKA